MSIIAGIWLFLSAFFWPHLGAQTTNDWIVGVLMAIVAWAAAYAPNVRFLNTALSIWLFISAFVLPTASGGTMASNIVVAVVVFVMSLMPGAPARRLHVAGGHAGGRPLSHP